MLTSHLNQVVKIIPFTDYAVHEFEHGLYSILTDSVETPKVDAFVDEHNAIATSVSSGFVHSSSIL